MQAASLSPVWLCNEARECRTDRHAATRWTAEMSRL